MMMKNERTRSSSSSPRSPPNCSSFETKRELVDYMLRTSGEPSECSEETKRRVSFDPLPKKYSALRFLILGILKALVRDGFRCIVTGYYDYRLLIPEVRQELEADAGATITECAHIFPESIAMTSGIDDKDAKVRFADLSSVAINHAYL